MSESEPAGQAEPAATSVASPAAPSPVTWPSARALVGNGLDLALRTTGQLRGASLVLALELLGVIGPLAILLVVIAEHQDVVAIDFVNASTSLLAPEDQSLVSILGFGILIGLFGVVAVVVEGRLIAAALLAGRFVGRPLSLLEALRRSRQTFWVLIRASILVQLPLGIIVTVVSDTLDPTGTNVVMGTIGTWLLSTLLTSPFAYVNAGIVLGGVGAVESIRRSIRLARSRWRLALVVALFAGVAQYLLVFGVSAGFDILRRVTQTFGLSLDQGPLVTFWTLCVVLVAIVAVGTLNFTVNAVAAAPEVVAFVGLTGFSGGLDRARDGALVGPMTGWNAVSVRPVRWLTVPMALGIGLAILLSVAGISNVMGRL